MNVFLQLKWPQRLNFLTLFVAGLLFWAGLASLLPTLPLYIQQVGGEAWIGRVMAFFALGLLLSKETLSKMTDVRGRKVVLTIGMSAIAIAPIGYYLLPNIPSLMFFRAIHGISIAAFVTAYSAIVVDISPAHCRGELLGYMSLVNPLGMAIGPAIGGYLQESMGFAPAILFSAVLGFVGLLCTSRIVEDKQEPTDSPSPKKNQRFWGLLFTPRIRIPAFVLLMIGFAFGTISTFIPIYIKTEGISLNIGLFYTVAAITSFLARLSVGRASDHYGRGVFISISLTLYSIATFLLWQASGPASFLIAAAFQGGAAGTLIPMMAALMADRAEPHERGQIFGLCMTGFDIGIAMAGPTMQELALRIGYGNTFGVATLLIWIGLLAFMTCSSKDLRHSFRFAIGQGKDIYATDA